MWDIIKAIIMLLSVSYVSIMLLKSFIATVFIERDNPCGMDDFEDFEIKDTPKRHLFKKGTIYE